MVKKTTKAPIWFLEIHKEHDRVVKAIGKILNVGSDWLEKHSDLDEFIEMKKLDKNEKEMIKIFLNYANTLTKYQWAKFRYENQDNEFGIADFLYFNLKTKRIEITEGLMSKATNFIKKMVKGNYEV